MKHISISVRLEGPTENDVRAAAEDMGVQISTVKNRGDTFHLYGSKIISVATSTVKVTTLKPTVALLD